MTGVNVSAKLESQRYLNHYGHCEREWVDIWSCMCNDHCPVCGHEIEPYKSLDLIDDDVIDRRRKVA